MNFLQAYELIIHYYRVIGPNNLFYRSDDSCEEGIEYGWSGEHGLLVLQQHFWKSLDGTSRAQVSIKAKRLGVVVITAEASDSIGENPISSEVI